MKIKVYTAMRMTGKYKDEIVAEARLLHRTLENYGFEVLCPVDKEAIEDIHEPLEQTSAEKLERFWRQDKEMIQEADILLDYMSCNKSDGVSKELGYARFCLFKPVVRVFPQCGINISRIEDDHITETLTDAVGIMLNLYGSYEKLNKWRDAMWNRSFPKWLAYQRSIHERYGISCPIAIL